MRHTASSGCGSTSPRRARDGVGAVTASVPRGRRSRRRLVLGLLALAAAIVGLRRAWLPLLGAALIVADPLRRADALVPFAGDVERIEYSAELFNAGYAEWLVVTNMPVARPGPRYAEQVRRRLQERDVPAARIVEAPDTVTSTYAEAVSLRAFAQARGWRSLLVVTSPYHTRRTRIIVRDVFRDSGIAVTVVPVVPGWYRPDSWWRFASSTRVTLNEYLKLALYLGGYRR